MSLSKYIWIGCIIIWAVVILGFIGLTLFNRARNRERKDDK